MRQIKTVLRPVGQTAHFDEEVNSLLADGWKLKKREVLKALGEISEAFNAPHISVLYAELERECPPWPAEVTE